MSDLRRSCDTCKHNPPSKEWPCTDCDMREPADRWEPKDVGDLISRQDAIKALSRLDISDGVGISCIASGVQDSAILAIDNLPSAEPEIIHCRDCKWRNVYRFPPKYDERDYCDEHGKTVSTDGFCSWAERRTDG